MERLVKELDALEIDLIEMRHDSNYGSGVYGALPLQMADMIKEIPNAKDKDAFLATVIPAMGGILSTTTVREGLQNISLDFKSLLIGTNSSPKVTHYAAALTQGAGSTEPITLGLADLEHDRFGFRIEQHNGSFHLVVDLNQAENYWIDWPKINRILKEGAIENQCDNQKDQLSNSALPSKGFAVIALPEEKIGLIRSLLRTSLLWKENSVGMKSPLIGVNVEDYVAHNFIQAVLGNIGRVLSEARLVGDHSITIPVDSQKMLELARFKWKERFQDEELVESLEKLAIKIGAILSFYETYSRSFYPFEIMSHHLEAGIRMVTHSGINLHEILKKIEYEYA